MYWKTDTNVIFYSDEKFINTPDSLDERGIVFEKSDEMDLGCKFSVQLDAFPESSKEIDSSFQFSSSMTNYI